MEKNLKITSLHESNTDFEFWLSKSVLERLEAIEFLRKQFIDYHNVNERLQRVCRVINKA